MIFVLPPRFADASRQQPQKELMQPYVPKDLCARYSPALYRAHPSRSEGLVRQYKLVPPDFSGLPAQPVRREGSETIFSRLLPASSQLRGIASRIGHPFFEALCTENLQPTLLFTAMSQYVFVYISTIPGICQ